MTMLNSKPEISTVIPIYKPRSCMLNENVLFQPYQLTEKLLLKNRIIMAPMTRAKAQDDGTPTSVMANYYARRADAGLIITEATAIRPDAKSFNNVPGIFTIAHLDGWRQVTDTVHQRDGKIFLQLWHTGRASHPQFIDGKLPLSASATTMTGRLYRSEGLFYGTSRAATLNEIAG